MSKVKPFFRVQIDPSEKSGGITKIRDKTNFFGMYLRRHKH